MISKYLRQRIQIVFSVPSFTIFLFSFHFHPPPPFFSLLVAYFLEFLPKSSLNPPLCPIELNFNLPSPPGEGGGRTFIHPSEELTGDGRYSPTDSYSATSSTFNMLNNHTRHPNDPTSFPPAASLINQKKHLDTYTISQLPREMKKLKTSALSNLRNQLQDGSRKRTSTASFSEENSGKKVFSKISRVIFRGGG